jgi:hypothetical protein
LLMSSGLVITFVVALVVVFAAQWPSMRDDR